MIDIHPEFARALIGVIPGGLAFIDRQAYVQWVNDEFAALLGTNRRRIIGRPATTLPFPLSATEPQLERVSAHDNLILVERWLKTEPMVGRLLQLMARQPIQRVLEPLTRNEAAPPAAAGVLSRGVGLQRLVTEISRSRRYDNPLSCLVIRVEGRAARVIQLQLKALSEFLKDQLRWVDVLVQWEVDRVLVVLPETGAEAAFRLQRKLAALIDTGSVPTLPGANLQWGVATWRRGDEASRFVRRAEAASLAQLREVFLRPPR